MDRKSPFVRSYRDLKAVFKRTRRREVLIFAVFLLMSLFFWVVETAREQNDAEITVAFIIENQPDNKVFTTSVPEHIHFHIRDINLNLLSYDYGNEVKDLRVDFNRYADVSGNFRISAAEMQSLILADLLPTTQITAVAPALIDARYATAEGKKLPVRLNVDYRPADNYRCQHVRFSPESVLVHAPAVMLDTMTMVTMLPKQYYQLTDTLEEKVRLLSPIGVNLSPDSIHIRIPVLQYVERTFSNIPVETSYVPDGHRLNIFPDRVAVTCLVDVAHYRKLSADDITLTVSYLDILYERKRKIPIRLKYRLRSDLNDEIITNLRVIPDSVEYVDERGVW